MRHALRLCSCGKRKEMAPDGKGSDRAESLEAAECRLDGFEDRWWKRYPSVEASRRNNWEEVIPMFALAPEVWCLLSKTNAIEILKEAVERHQDTDPVPNDRAAAGRWSRPRETSRARGMRPSTGWTSCRGSALGVGCPESRFSHLHVPAEGGGGRSDRPPRSAGASGRMSRFRSAASEGPCEHLSTATIMDCTSFGRGSGPSRDGHGEGCVLIAEPRQRSPGTPWNGPCGWGRAV